MPEETKEFRVIDLFTPEEQAVINRYYQIIRSRGGNSTKRTQTPEQLSARGRASANLRWQRHREQKAAEAAGTIARTRAAGANST